jgi:[ribosomal protein S18]-alanine N-acetyltransferase
MELSAFMTRRNAITLVAELAGEVAAGLKEPEPGERVLGFAVAQPFRKTGRILTLDVVPEARRHGLASRLMLECEERVRRRGCTEMYLETAVNNEAALKLYHKLGYRIIRTLPGYYHSHGLDAFLMGKNL